VNAMGPNRQRGNEREREADEWGPLVSGCGNKNRNRKKKKVFDPTVSIWLANLNVLLANFTNIKILKFFKTRLSTIFM
jgi:hypothetical protein